MKHYYTYFLLLITSVVFAQQPYYSNGQNNVDFSLTGQALYDALQLKIDNNIITTYTYGDIRDDFKIMELDPADVTDTNVLLTYGFVNNTSCSGSSITDRRIRDKDNFGGDNCDYNREHVFARSNANPGMGDVNNSSTGIAADPQNLRATDVRRNGDRGNKLFAAGSGNSGDVGSGNWYPGDEWRGDVARIMMYMYVRYGDRCLPSLNAVGNTQGSTDMLQILLQWNADDPVSEVEDNRNNRLEIVYGNRNPFIDNPFLATAIWGGVPAEDRFGTLSTDLDSLTEFGIYPNPTTSNITLRLNKPQSTKVEVYDILGKKVLQENIDRTKIINTSQLRSGVYILRLTQGNNTTSRKLVKQ
ncbi:endonuclease [Winogradskyella immobilis]|uniref:Endonuclease n=1 Tax=Winogradskyella immobilis TaxID=2816852 RepID=A0ABS8EK13_9FLAO|nr:endonuclease [Winogradskyella immobilis]MCC1483548.1 endonuclease [Winogradskyella immobilis]MCG0015642.1 endonuclease [Winogradskyella immobilis]